MEVEVYCAVRGAGDEAKEAGGEFGGEEKKKNYVGPGIWHFRDAFGVMGLGGF